MSIGVFSDFRTNTAQNSSYVKKDIPQQPVAQTSIVPEQKTNKTLETIKTIAPIVVPLVTIPITAGITYKLSTKSVDALKGQVSSLSEKVQNMASDVASSAEVTRTLESIKQKQDATATALTEALKTTKKSNAKIWSAIIAAAGLSTVYKPKDMSKGEASSDVANTLANRMNTMQSAASAAARDAQRAIGLNGNSLMTKYTKNYHGIPLLQNNDSINKNEQKYQSAIKHIKQAASTYLYEAPSVEPITKPNPTLWSVTSEFAPIKEGGLGSVPVEIQNNVSKLGIDIPTFIPMYQNGGTATFRQEGDSYYYKYGKNEFKLDKVASFKVDTYQGGKSKTEDVEVYLHTKEVDGHKKQLVFIKNDNYFNGTIYQTGEKSEEPEKFAFFSKAVYEFAKAKEDIGSVKGLSIPNQEIFNSIKAPDALILNDWQASPIAALARYKAPMENAYSKLSDAAAQKLQNMTIITIGHNTMYQGSTRNNNDDAQRRDVTSNILNTLFDNFASDIVTNALTKASETDPTDEGLRNLDNALVVNYHDQSSNHTNLLNMGVCLSNYFHPVSQNYAKEIISDEHPELAGELRWALNQKNNAGSLVGIINGNDFNNLSIEAKADTIKKQTGLDFVTYSKASDIKDVMDARLQNKINFYNNFMMPFTKTNDKTNHDADVEKVRALTSRLEFVDKSGNMKLPVLTDEEIAQTPIISSVGRLVSQKGIPVMTKAISMLMSNWETEFPGKPKPIFYLAGQDGEGGKQREYIEKLRAELPKEDADRVVFAHGFAPMTAITAASDFFLLPSIFEPCGLTQGEAFAVATPVIGSAVGGIVDTVNRFDKKNGFLTDKSKPLSAEGFYKAMVDGLKTYYNDKDTYQTMVKNSLAEDFSWIQKHKQGPVFEYLERIGFDRTTLPEVC